MATAVRLFVPPPPLSPSKPHLLLHFRRHVTLRPPSTLRNPSSSCPVPFEQQPVNEYKSLSESFPFSWASADPIEFSSRLFVAGAAFAVLVGLPVALIGSPEAWAEPVRPVVAAVSSGLGFVTLAVVRMYLGWAYVGNRLLSATVECN